MSVTHNLTPILAVLGSGLASVAISKLTHVNTIVCFFVAGALLGEYGFGVVAYDGEISFLAELGLSFFLFEVGSHLSLKKLREEWREFLTLGPLHAFFVTAVFTLLGVLLGYGFLKSVLVSAILSLSSTAVVLKMIESRGEGSTPTSRDATAVLLFQDLVAVILLALIPSMENPDEAFSISMKVLGSAGGSFLGVVIFGRLFLRPFYRWVFSQQADEVFTASALFTVLLIASAVSNFGLSLPLGAFFAGVSLAETNYSYLVRSELLPFRALLLSLFFLSIGMTIDFYFLISNIPLLIVVTALFFGLKIVSGALSLRFAGESWSTAVRTGALLSQGSEFGFALLAALTLSGQLQANESALLSGVLALSLALAGVTAAVGCRISMYLVKEEVEEENDILSGMKEVIIVRFDELAQELAGILESEGIPYRGHDMDWERITEAKSRGFNVYFSNPDRPRTISRASLGEASVIVSLLDDEQVLLALIDGLQKVAPTVPLVVAVQEPQLLERVIQRGVEKAYLRNDRTLELLSRDTFLGVGRSRGEAAEALARHRSGQNPQEVFSEWSSGSTPEPVAQSA